MRRFSLLVIAFALLVLSGPAARHADACDPDPNAEFLIGGELPGGG